MADLADFSTIDENWIQTRWLIWLTFQLLMKTEYKQDGWSGWLFNYWWKLNTNTMTDLADFSTIDENWIQTRWLIWLTFQLLMKTEYKQDGWSGWLFNYWWKLNTNTMTDLADFSTIDENWIQTRWLIWLTFQLLMKTEYKHDGWSGWLFNYWWKLNTNKMADLADFSTIDENWTQTRWLIWLTFQLLMKTEYKQDGWSGWLFNYWWKLNTNKMADSHRICFPFSSIRPWADWDVGTIRAEQSPLRFLIRGTLKGLEKSWGTWLSGSFMV